MPVWERRQSQAVLTKKSYYIGFVLLWGPALYYPIFFFFFGLGMGNNLVCDLIKTALDSKLGGCNHASHLTHSLVLTREPQELQFSR